jgi:hypothetical protein
MSGAADLRTVEQILADSVTLTVLAERLRLIADGDRGVSAQQRKAYLRRAANVLAAYDAVIPLRTD